MFAFKAINFSISKNKMIAFWLVVVVMVRACKPSNEQAGGRLMRRREAEREYGKHIHQFLDMAHLFYAVGSLRDLSARKSFQSKI